MSRIYRWFMDDVSHAPMGVARIFLGFTLLGAYGLRIPFVPFLYGPHGFAGVEFYEIAGTSKMLSFGLGRWMLFHVPENATYFLYGILLISAFCFMIGFKTRFFGVLCIILHVTFDQRNILSTAGWSKLAHCFILYIVCSRGSYFLSVDAWLKKPRDLSVLMAPAWPIRLLQLHVCTMYFVSSFPRLNQGMWTKGFAVTFSLLHFEYSRFNTYFFGYTDLLKIPDLLALGLEAFAFIGLWIPGVAPFWALGLMGMHITLEATLHVDWWNFMMIGGLMAFLPKEWFRYGR